MPRPSQRSSTLVLRGDARILTLSDDIANTLRSVVIVCALNPVARGMDLSLPTYVILAPGESGLESEVSASPASPFTLPKDALVERFSTLPRKAQLRVDKAIRLVLGYEEWPL